MFLICIFYIARTYVLIHIFYCLVMISTLDHVVIKNIVATMRQSGSYCCDNGDNDDNGDNGKSRERNLV